MAPPEAWDTLNAAYDVHTLAVARANYERDETRELLANSVADRGPMPSSPISGRALPAA